MPSLHTKASSPFWLARWQRGGKDIWRSTEIRCRTKDGEEINREKAEVALKRLMKESDGSGDLEELVTRLLDALAKLPEEKQKSQRHELSARILAGQKQKLLLSEGWPAWLKVLKEREPAEKTKLGYEAIWKRFKAWTEAPGLEFLHEVTAEHVEVYCEDLWASKVSEATYNAHVKFLRAAFKKLRLKAGLAINVWQDVEMKERRKDEETGRRNLTDEELKQVFGRAQGNMKLMFCIGLFTGLRLGDVVNLRWDEIDNDRYSTKRGPKPGFVVVRPIKTARLGKYVTIPIHDNLRAMLRHHRRGHGDCEFLFPKERDAYAESPANITKPMQEFFQSCGLETNLAAENGQRRRAIIRVGFHSLRHSFVSLCAKAGTPLHVVQKLVGHGNPLLTSEVYTEVDSEQRREAIDLLPDFGAGKSRATRGKIKRRSC